MATHAQMCQTLHQISNKETEMNGGGSSGASAGGGLEGPICNPDGRHGDCRPELISETLEDCLHDMFEKQPSGNFETSLKNNPETPAKHKTQ